MPGWQKKVSPASLDSRNGAAENQSMGLDESGIVVQYGRRQTDLLPGVFIREDGKYYIKAAHFSNLNSQVSRLSLLMDSARAIMGEIGLDALLRLIMDSVTRVMSADRSTLFLVDRENQQLWSRVAQGAPEIRVPLGEGIVGHTARTGETLNILDAYQDARFNKDFDQRSGYKTKSILCMPIKNPAGEIIGAIQVLNKKDGTVFTADDEDLLGAFVSLAGISLENARAYDELQKERDSLEVKVRERTAALAEAKQKSDDLLLNILPAETAEELKKSGRATPRRYDSVTVLFTDFKGFTGIAEKLNPEALIEELDRCFFYFDEIMERYGLEKIKTIGDSYMCAGGIPKPSHTHPVDAVLAGLEIRRFMQQMKEIKQSIGEPFWELRIGIHTGPVVAGIVGKKKFAYDIWGDAVNTASRMESSGEPGQINISGHLQQIIAPFFVTEYRGKVKAKNKGEIDMHFVTGIRPELSTGGAGEVPNEKFAALRTAMSDQSPAFTP